MEDELGNPSWIGIARSFLMSVATARTDDALRVLAPEVTYRVLGHHSLSGEFADREGVAEHLAAIITQTTGRFDPVKFDDWMLGLTHVSIIVDVDVEVGGKAQRLRHLIVMRFNADDLIDEVMVFFPDPEVAERIYGQYLREDSADRS